MKKKQQEIVIKIQDSEALKKYLSTDYNKIVCLNVFDKFWGPVEVLDSQIKKFLEFKDNSTKTDFISCDKELTADLFTKYTFSSKPKFFVLHVIIFNLARKHCLIYRWFRLPKADRRNRKKFNTFRCISIIYFKFNLVLRM